MIRALSRDLRSRIVANGKSGVSRRLAPERFGVSEANAIQWRQSVLAYGYPAPRKRFRDVHQHAIETQGTISRIEHERVSHAAHLALVGKGINNLDQRLTMILALIEANPAKANKTAARVREMRKAQAGERSAVSTKEA